MATNLGVLASIALTSSIVCSALGAIADTIAAFHYVSAGLSIVGLLLMIWAAVVVLIENARLQLIIESELSDVPELMQAAHDKHRVGAQARK